VQRDVDYLVDQFHEFPTIPALVLIINSRFSRSGPVLRRRDRLYPPAPREPVPAVGQGIF
jgi:hypothetical protein